MSVQDVITSGRVAISAEAKALTQQILDQYHMGIEVVDIKLQDVNPPEKVKPAFNEVNSAKQEQEQAINLAEAERNKIIPETKGKAEQEVSKAEGYALQVVNRARGDSEKFEQILIEYEKAPTITRTRMYLDLMASVLRRTESVTIIDPEITGVLPIYSAEGKTALAAQSGKGR
jgi:membrane protease subunit HflK